MTRAVVKLESLCANLELTKEVWASLKGDRWRTRDELKREGAGFAEQGQTLTGDWRSWIAARRGFC